LSNDGTLDGMAATAATYNVLLADAAIPSRNDESVERKGPWGSTSRTSGPSKPSKRPRVVTQEEITTREGAVPTRLTHTSRDGNSIEKKGDSEVPLQPIDGNSPTKKVSDVRGGEEELLAADIDNDDDDDETDMENAWFHVYEEALTDTPDPEDTVFEDALDFSFDLSTIPNFGSDELPPLMSYACNPYARPHFHKSARVVFNAMKEDHMVRNGDPKGEFNFDFVPRPVTRKEHHIGYANYDQDGAMLKTGSTSNAPDRKATQNAPKYMELFNINKFEANVDKVVVDEVFLLGQNIIDDVHTPYELKV
jgi:hypothetical protein